MSIPGQEAVNRFLENEVRLDDFLNTNGTYTTSEGSVIETLPSLANTVGTLTLTPVFLGSWATTTTYNRNAVVNQGGTNYICKLAHISGTFATDLAANKWQIYQGVLLSDLQSSAGSSFMGFLLPYAGAGIRTAQCKMQDSVSVLDFYANGVSGAMVDPTGVIDSGLGIQAALNTGKPVVFPLGGIFKKSVQIIKSGKVIIFGNGATILDDGPGFRIDDGAGSRIRDLNFMPVTIPYTLLRDPATWVTTGANVIQSLEGYIPTSQDFDVWGASGFTATITGTAPAQTMTVRGMTIAPGQQLAIGQAIYYPAVNIAANRIGTIQSGPAAGGNGVYTIATTSTQNQVGVTMSSGLLASIQAQMFVQPYQRPGIWMRSTTGSANKNVEISGITGYLTSIILEGYQNSTVKHCTFGGSTGEASIYFLNGIGVDICGNVTSIAYGFAAFARGSGNKAIKNRTCYSTYCGIAMAGNDNFLIEGNDCYLNGESGIKTMPHDGTYPNAAACTNGVIKGNNTFSNFYDGIDCGTVYGVTGYLAGHITIANNTSSNNRASGITTEGTLYMSVSGNIVNSNGATGINATGQYGTFSDNTCTGNCKFGPTGVANLWGSQQMWEMCIIGDGVASNGNSINTVYNPPYTYAYLHQGQVANSAVPTVGKEGTDVGNSVQGVSNAMYVHPNIPTDSRGIVSYTNLKPMNGKVNSGSTVLAAANTTWYTVIGSTTGMVLLRDNTAGGIALITFDPIGGAPVAITNTIPGLSIQSSSGNLQIRVASGAPRTLGFLALLTQ